MRRETIELDEVNSGRAREALSQHGGAVGIMGVVGDRRIVGVVVESAEPAPAPPEEPVAEPEPEKKRGRR